MVEEGGSRIQAEGLGFHKSQTELGWRNLCWLVRLCVNHIISLDLSFLM